MCELNKNRNQVTFTSSIVAYSLAYLRKTYGNSLSFLYTSAVIKRVVWEQHNICICKYVEFDDEMQSASACHKAEWTSLPYLGRTTSGALTECVCFVHFYMWTWCHFKIANYADEYAAHATFSNCHISMWTWFSACFLVFHSLISRLCIFLWQALKQSTIQKYK